MEAIYLLIPIALILVIIGIAVFFWAVKNDQFDDLEGPAHSILFDDEPRDTRSKTNTTTNNSAKDKPER
jgi:cbb3-type cytochrome oxidase maturation protein